MHGEDSWLSARARGLQAEGVLLVCDVTRQQLDVLDRGPLSAQYPVSTSALGVGGAEGSFRTPCGWHEVKERIGAGHAAGTVFRDREPTGEILPEQQWSGGSTDLILTRILWLDGLEEGVNRGAGRDSHQRFIYIHGTNHEELLRQPASHGCIRMGNRDLVALFARLADRPAWCLILETRA